MRNPPRRNLSLEALLEKRDHLKIQMNLVEHGPKPDAARLHNMRIELEELESQISRHRAIY
jgi:hypothetical protein